MAHVNKLLTALVTAIIATTVTADIPSCEGLLEGTMLRTEDCTGWYRCVHGVAQDKLPCHTDMVFSILAHTCVTRGSVYDDCTYTPPEMCDAGAGLIPHATECQLYYDCSKAEEWKGEVHLSECIYPNQFNSDTLTCDDFENVQCRGRKDIKEYCEYRVKKCAINHVHGCYPLCDVFNPSCLGLPDGYNFDGYRKWTRDYVRCYKERNVDTGRCPYDAAGVQLFHPDLRECVPLDMIPQEHGGTMPDCSGLPDGLHADYMGRCDQYTVCKDEKTKDTIKCDGGFVFDSYTELCVSFEASCTPPPCGNPETCPSMSNPDA